MINAEQEVIAFLSGLVDGVRAYGVAPPERPQKFVTVERTGGTAERFMDHAQIADQVWAATRTETSQLAITLRAHCYDLALKPWCAGVYLGGLYNFPDPASGHARYQFTLNIDVMTH